jgi:hypothetical protein
MQVLPIVRYDHMPRTADLPARDITVLLPSVAQQSSARDGHSGTFCECLTRQALHAHGLW